LKSPVSCWGYLLCRLFFFTLTTASTPGVQSEPVIQPKQYLYEVWVSIDRTRFAIARLRELELAHFNLTIEQASFLHILRNHGSPMTIEVLQDTTLRQPHSISTLINRMNTAGLLKKKDLNLKGTLSPFPQKDKSYIPD
jgi:hypothetical protein